MIQPPDGITARWLQSTGAGDDVLEVTVAGAVRVTMHANAATIRQIADAGELERFGMAASHVGMALHLYRLAHEPDHARASEAEARAALAARNASVERQRAAREQGMIE